MNTWLAVFIGGGLGSMARFAISRLITSDGMRVHLPWATISANMLACVVLALVMLKYQEQLMQKPVALALLAVGFCGGFSTFSTFSYENYLLMKDGNFSFALLNVVISVAACLAVFYLVAQRT